MAIVIVMNERQLFFGRQVSAYDPAKHASDTQKYHLVSEVK